MITSMPLKLVLKTFCLCSPKGQPVFAHLLRCEAVEVGNHDFMPRASYLRKAWLVRKAGSPVFFTNKDKGGKWLSD